jgi:hypothetical protein
MRLCECTVTSLSRSVWDKVLILRNNHDKTRTFHVARGYRRFLQRVLQPGRKWAFVYAVRSELGYDLWSGAVRVARNLLLAANLAGLCAKG